MKTGTMNKEAEQQPAHLTQDLCGYLAALRFGDMPARAVHEGRRGVLDWLGCVLAGSADPTIDRVVDVLREFGGKPQATVFGRKLKLGLIDAALANGQIGHVLDFDDTHIVGTSLMHTSSPVLAALFALAERKNVSGATFLLAYAAGFEAGIRTGRASPAHFEGGWHLTGTLGSIAAAVAAGKLLELDAGQLAHAMAIGATQAAGMQQNRGTMCKSLHAGKAAMGGVLAGLLAQRGFDSSLEIIEGKLGFCRIYSDVAAPEALVADLGNHWEITRNGHKAHACGIKLHALIDAVLAIRSQATSEPAKVSAIKIRVHPEVISVNSIVAPITGLQAKFSIYHSAAVALIDGAAQSAQYTDQRAVDPAVVALRQKVKVIVDESFRKEQAQATLIAGGNRYEAAVEHASGTPDNPMSDAAIEAKFIANAQPVIGTERTHRIAELVWKLDKLEDVRELTVLCA
jgi:2-methylcitrate dehydratase PrpD